MTNKDRIYALSLQLVTELETQTADAPEFLEIHRQGQSLHQAIAHWWAS